MAEKKAVTLIILVDNEFGVLTRLTALLRREGWNIQSLAVSVTKNSAVSKFTVCVECVDNTVRHVAGRIKKLGCVRELSVYSPERHLSRELALVHLSGESLSAALPVLEKWKAERVDDVANGKNAYQIAQSPENVDRFLEELGAIDIEIEDMARSGAIVLDMSTDAYQAPKI